VSSFLQAWANRFAIDPDGVNYLDIAHAYFRGDWKMALNSYWSPLYSWVVGFVLHLFKPSLYWESTVLHLVNFAIFLLALWSFEFFLAALIRCQHATRSSGDPRAPLPECVWWALGYPLFLISTLVMVPLSLSTPDLCVAALVYLAAGMVLRIRAGDLRWRNFAALGGVLGIAYLAKAVMFPLAFAFLPAAAIAPAKLRRAVPRTLLALIVFLLIGGPLVLALSRATEQLTFGDSGRIAYEVFVSRVEQPWRQGELTNAPGARHPLRRILNGPPVYEFATPVGGTYPPWYNPSYWRDGLALRFDLRGQLAVLRQSLEIYFQVFSSQRELLVSFLALLLLERKWRLFAREAVTQWPVGLPAVAGLGLYALVHVESRLVAPFVVLLWAALFSALSFRRSQLSRRFLQCIIVAAVIVMGLRIVKLASYELLGVVHPPAHVQWQVAVGLREIGVKPGDKAASIGHTNVADYWAHLTGVRIVADIPLEGAPSFWAASPEVKSQVIEAFSRVGANVIVTNALPSLTTPPGWRRIGNTDYFAYILPRTGSAAQPPASNRPT